MKKWRISESQISMIYRNIAQKVNCIDAPFFFIAPGIITDDFTCS